MGTRSDIIVHMLDGSWKRIYCHWDGYLSHNGRILAQHYATQKLAEKLVKHGDMSSLAEKCTKPKGHSFDNRKDGYCVYYGRDRGETDVEGVTGDTLSAVWPSEDTWTEFTYVFDGGEWYVANPDEGSQTAIKLVDALAADAVGENPVKSYVKAPWGIIGQRA